MGKVFRDKPHRLILICAAILALAYIIYLQFSYPTFYDPDSYYHAAISNVIKQHGVHYHFRWAQFSTLKDSFADKDFLFHVLTVPFLYITDDIVLAGKYALIFYTILFFTAYLFILKRYLSDYLAALFLLLPLSSSIFTIYLLQLRSVTLANIFLILGIYFLLQKKQLWLFTLSILYPLTHISFFMVIALSVICETFRYLTNKDFFAKNIYAVLLGSVVGCVIHPNFPNNLYMLYLNGMVVPLRAIAGKGFDVAGELMPLDIKSSIIGNFASLLVLAIAAVTVLRTLKKWSLSTLLWCAASLIYLVLALSGIRYWYQVNILSFIFFASYINDRVKSEGWNVALRKTYRIAIPFLVAVIIFAILSFKQVMGFMKYSAPMSAHREDIAYWMRENLPKDETIYHSYWPDSSYLFCINPKDNYLNILDPIYMTYRHPKEFALIQDLSMGRVGNPHEALIKIFKARYGYARTQEPLCRQIRLDSRHFTILYEDPWGIIFEVIG